MSKVQEQNIANNLQSHKDNSFKACDISIYVLTLCITPCNAVL